MAILVTGGAGYIGLHTICRLLECCYNVVILDNLVNASSKSLERVRKLTDAKFEFYKGDVRDRVILKKIFSEHHITDVIHFAGLKSVSESVRHPIEYYDNNVAGTLTLIEEMMVHDVPHIIFSSSATVYGTPEKIPVVETLRVGGTTNPYGTSKLMAEQILQDITQAKPSFRTTVLRYFNPVGAHISGQIGEDPNGIPNNLMPYICQVAAGKISHLLVFGNDYPTKDGTGIRDFIHVMDLAEGHVAALAQAHEGPNYKMYNLGTGTGYSVLDLITAFERVNHISIPFQFVARRAGDIAECWSDPSKANKELGWRATRNLEDMLRDAWNWQKNNPNGFSEG